MIRHFGRGRRVQKALDVLDRVEAAGDEVDEVRLLVSQRRLRVILFFFFFFLQRQGGGSGAVSDPGLGNLVGVRRDP